MEIVQRPDVKVAECSILAQTLADLAKDGEPASVWVTTVLLRRFAQLFLDRVERMRCELLRPMIP